MESNNQQRRGYYISSRAERIVRIIVLSASLEPQGGRSTLCALPYRNIHLTQNVAKHAGEWMKMGVNDTCGWESSFLAWLALPDLTYSMTPTTSPYQP